MRRRSGYRWIETLLLLVGIIFVGIWAWEEIKTEAVQNWESWSFERQRAGQPVNIADYLKAKEEQVVETVKTWCGFPPPPEPPAPPHFVVTERPVAPPPVQPPPLEENALIGRIAIPRLHLSTTVREGVGSDTLSVAAGHIPGTATPGPVGNV